MNELPIIAGKGKHAELLVDGMPFLMRSGEIHNSSASSLAYMDKHVWPALRGRHMNSVLVPVYWECMEPQEGSFNFTLVDGLLAQARREGMRLGLLWFGLWKNGESSYVPAWVKEDRERFKYVRTREGGYPEYHGRTVFTISPLCDDAIEADARAFAALTAHLREVDQENTVILIQVENEVGLLGGVRDQSPEAENRFRSVVPHELTNPAGSFGTWQEVYGEYADEAFMAWHYARAVERIASAGKAELALPMGVNAWLEQEPWTPGDAYPSGGPQAKNFAIWSTAAPSLDFYAPDIYVPAFRDVLREYAQGDRPILIPETRTEAAFYLYALGAYGALCFSPFGIEDVDADSHEADVQTMALLKIPPEVLTAVKRNGLQLFATYELTESMEDILNSARQQGRLYGFLRDGSTDTDSETVELADLCVDVLYGPPDPAKPMGGGLIVELGDYELLVLAIRCVVRFRSRDGRTFEVLNKEEGRFEKGQWVRGRILNGDERYYHSFGDQVTLHRFKLLPVS